MPIPTQLPQPDKNALAHSQKLAAYIGEKIQAAGGKIPFDAFMQDALYAPGLGYYSAGASQFGATGDFVTAPEISALFSRCLARQCQQILQTLPTAAILEFGAGSGIMAADLLHELKLQQSLPAHYFIIEPSAALREKQQQLLAQRLPEFYAQIDWLDQLPKQFSGIILANEVLDAMPVKRIARKQDKFYEHYVSWNEQGFCWIESLITEAALRTHLTQLLPEQDNYVTEYNPLLAGWLTAVSAILQQGVVLLIDYGFPQREFYHPDRYDGTLMCHYRHHAHADPLMLVGLQDITAHVDFTAVAENAFTAGFSVAGYTNQASFLLGCGITDLAVAATLEQQWQVNQQLKKLTLPSEMGELFKVMALTKHWDAALSGFDWLDLRSRL